jgi:hypothetical protein
MIDDGVRIEDKADGSVHPAGQFSSWALHQGPIQRRCGSYSGLDEVGNRGSSGVGVH